MWERVFAFFLGPALAMLLAGMRAIEKGGGGEDANKDAKPSGDSSGAPKLEKNPANFDSQNSAYDPTGTNFSGGPGTTG